MKFGVVMNMDNINLGDAIQTVAAMRLLPKVNEIIDRERMNLFKSENPVRTICNGYFMNNCNNWPPSDKIVPLFISFHISNKNKCSDKLINHNLISYYKKYEPIGCRDHYTLKLFKRYKIDSYFSGCITLTLKNYESKRSDEIIFVDPFLKINKEKERNKYFELLVPPSVRDNIKFITHFGKSNDRDGIIKEAEYLISLYSKARLVVTSRIHCALPCLALGTPVYFVDIGYERKNMRNRFAGILELLNLINDNYIPYSSSKPLWKLFRLIKLDYLIGGKNRKHIDWEKQHENSEIFFLLRDKIIKNVNKFIIN